MIVAVFDNETTGLVSCHSLKLDRQPEVIEFACVLAEWDDLSKVRDQYEVLIKPSLGPLPAKTIETTHLTDEDLKDCMSFDKVADKIQSLLEGVDVICGHNLSFDMEMIDLEFERLRRKIAWPAVKLCTVEQTCHITGNRINLGDLHLTLTGQPHKNAHRAMEDVMATLRCLREIRVRGWL